MISKVEALKRYFSTPEKPVTSYELIELRKASASGFDGLAKLAAKELGEELNTSGQV